MCSMEYDDDDGRQGLQEDDLLDAAEVDTLIRDSIIQTIGDSLFELASIKPWTNEIIDGCLKRLTALRKPFKYVVTCNLAQRVSLLQISLRLVMEDFMMRHKQGCTW